MRCRCNYSQQRNTGAPLLYGKKEDDNGDTQVTITADTRSQTHLGVYSNTHPSHKNRIPVVNSNPANPLISQTQPAQEATAFAGYGHVNRRHRSVQHPERRSPLEGHS
ncbi:hypothetical protein ACTXT7_012812 [Hymenolepis weldensis]